MAKGFVLTKEKKHKMPIYLLTKEDIVIKICEFDVYEISMDYGVTFTPINESTFVSYNDKTEIEDIINKYNSCDIRDRDIYDPTTKIIAIIEKYIQ